MPQTTPTVSGGMNALLLPVFFVNLATPRSFFTDGGGAFCHKEGPKLGVVSCWQGEKSWIE
jgi:ribulose-bisphosphate carboxylase large chain